MTVRPVRGVVTLLTAGALSLACGCSGGGAGSRGTPSVDPYEVAATAQAQRASASASVQASRDAALGPDLVAKRDAALATQAPQKPAQASENSPEGAILSAKYFIGLYQYTFLTGSTKEFEAMSSSQCVFCKSVMDSAKELHADGGWGDPWTIEFTSTEYHHPNPGYDYSRVDITMNSAETVSHSGDGKGLTVGEPEEGVTLIFAMAYGDNGWTVREVEVKK